MISSIDNIFALEERREGLRNSISFLKKENDKELSRLTSLRREFEGERTEQELKLQEREKQVKIKLALIEQQIQDETKGLEYLRDESDKVFIEFTEKINVLLEKIPHTLLKVDGILLKAERYKEIEEELIKQTQDRISKLDEMTLKNSKYEKELNKREEKIDKKLNAITERLNKTRQLVYWHKNPNITFNDEL